MNFFDGDRPCTELDVPCGQLVHEPGQTNLATVLAYTLTLQSSPLVYPQSWTLRLTPLTLPVLKMEHSHTRAVDPGGFMQELRYPQRRLSSQVVGMLESIMERVVTEKVPISLDVIVYLALYHSHTCW